MFKVSVKPLDFSLFFATPFASHLCSTTIRFYHHLHLFTCHQHWPFSSRFLAAFLVLHPFVCAATPLSNLICCFSICERNTALAWLAFACLSLEFEVIVKPFGIFHHHSLLSFGQQLFAFYHRLHLFSCDNRHWPCLLVHQLFLCLHQFVHLVRYVRPKPCKSRLLGHCKRANLAIHSTPIYRFGAHPTTPSQSKLEEAHWRSKLSVVVIALTVTRYPHFGPL